MHHPARTPLQHPVAAAGHRLALISVQVGKAISKYKTGKHFNVAIGDTALAVARRQGQIDAEAALDGFYVLRTPIPAAQLEAPAVVSAYKNLKYVEKSKLQCCHSRGSSALSSVPSRSVFMRAA